MNCHYEVDVTLHCRVPDAAVRNANEALASVLATLSRADARCVRDAQITWSESRFVVGGRDHDEGGGSQ